MTVLVTGANGFVGRWVIGALLAAGHTVVAAGGPDIAMPRGERQDGVRWIGLDLLSDESVRAAAGERVDAVIHLAGFASGAAALKNPGLAWDINAAGTARLLQALGDRRATGAGDPLVLLVSSAEVYGPSPRPLVETDPVRPRSPYAASKAGAELAAQETAARTGLRVVTARPFPHTGPGQDERFAIPSFARRLRLARQLKTRVVTVGNLDVTRDMLDVRDVAGAYLALLERGTPGEAYNVSSGIGQPLRAVFHQLAAIVGVDAIPETDAAYMRPADLPCLIGDSSKLRTATGWAPSLPLDRTLRDLVNAQAD